MNIEQHFVSVENQIRGLMARRSCECELAGIEGALALAHDCMERAKPAFVAAERSEHIDQTYLAMVIVATIIEKEQVLAWEQPEKIDRCLAATSALLQAMTPHLETRVGAFQRAAFAPDGLFRVPDHH